MEEKSKIEEISLNGLRGISGPRAILQNSQGEVISQGHLFFDESIGKSFVRNYKEYDVSKFNGDILVNHGQVIQIWGGQGKIGTYFVRKENYDFTIQDSQ